MLTEATKAMKPKTRQRLDQLRKLRQRMEQQLESLSQQEVELILEEDLRRNEQYKTLQKKVAAIKGRLHLVRVRIARKEYSIRTRESALQKLREMAEQYRREEQEKVREMEQFEREIEALKRGLLKQATGK